MSFAASTPLGLAATFSDDALFDSTLQLFFHLDSTGQTRIIKLSDFSKYSITGTAYWRHRLDTSRTLHYSITASSNIVYRTSYWSLNSLTRSSIHTAAGVINWFALSTSQDAIYYAQTGGVNLYKITSVSTATSATATIIYSSLPAVDYNNAILVGTRIVAHATTSTAMIVIDITNESSITYATYTGITGGIRSISAHPSGNFVFVPKQTTSAIFYWNVNTTFSSFTQAGGLTTPQLIAFDTVNKTAIIGNASNPAVIYRTGDDPFTTMALAMTLGHPTNGSSNGTIVLSVVGGYSTKTYLWSNGSTTQNLTGLGPGTYSVSVTDSFGIVATLGGGTLVNTTPATGSATTQNRSSISAGTYSVTVTDTVGTTASASFVVTSPASSAPPTASLSSTNPTTYGGTNGSVALTVSEGTSPFTYAWSNGATTQNLSSVGAGTYSVTVTDSSSQTGTASVTLTSPPGASLSPTNPSTFGGTNGSVNLTVSQGTSPFTYSWSNGATTQNVSSLSVGTFSVTVTDAASRTGTASVTLTSPPGASLSLTNPSTFGGTNGSITLTVSQGTSPFTYAWSNGATTQNISSLSVGTYSVTVTDAASRTGTASVTLTSPPGVTGTITHITTNGGSNGAISVSVTQGTTPYAYAWTGSSVTTAARTSLSVGTYVVTVTDALSRTGSSTFVVTNPPVVTAAITNATVYAAADGALDVSVTQGLSPFTYAWTSSSVTTQDRTALAAGSYSVSVTDSISRTTSASFTVTQPPAMTLVVTPVVLSASWPAVPSSTYYKTTYQATGGTETTNTRDLTTRECLITGLAASTEYTLRVYARDNLVTGLYAEFAPYRRVFTTPAAIAANFDKTVLLTTKTVSPISTAAGSSSATVVTATYDLTALPTSSLTAVADKLASILSTGDTVQIPLSFGEQTKEVKSTIVKLNETVAMPSSSGTYDVPLSSLQAVFMPFTSAGGASQSANLTLGDSSTVTVSFDQTANTVAISGHTYEVGDIFVLGGKKVTIMDVKS